MSIGLQINIEEIDNHIVLRLMGEITQNTFITLEKKISILLNEGHKKIFLDFSKIETINRAGLRLLLSLSKKFVAKGGRLIIFSVSDEIKNTLKMSQIKNSLKICDNQKEAFLEKA